MDHPSPSIPRQLGCASLRMQLQESGSKANSPGVCFYPIKLLNNILSYNNIKNFFDSNPKFSHLNEIQKEGLVARIRPKNDITAVLSPSQDGRDHYLRIFALLILLRNEHHIEEFIKHGMSDGMLPLAERRRLAPLQSKGWMTWQFEWFEDKQWSMLSPFLDYAYVEEGGAEKGKARHYVFDENTIYPWRRVPGKEKRHGGWSRVEEIEINPDSHGFDRVLRHLKLQNRNRFALKVLDTTPTYADTSLDARTRFENEMQQLRRFNGLENPHLITLLATFEHRTRFHFIFPWAETNLEDYWKNTPPSQVTGIWVAKQITGIMGAVYTIHEPGKHLQLADANRYGRHGDLKPDNILLIRTDDDLGTLVVTDLGLSSFNRKMSRSRIPNKHVCPIPNYRPPECDEGDDACNMSRAYDIWCLGCLFLDFLTWYLGGYELLERAIEDQKSRNQNGVRKRSFYEAVENVCQDNTPSKFRTKTCVSRLFVELHSHSACSQFVHDALDIIETLMLVVLGEGRSRATSQTLVKKFKGLVQKAHEDADYAGKGVPRN